MRYPTTLGAAFTAALMTLSAADVTAQMVYNADDADRRASTVFAFADAGPLVAASISYSQPTWKSEYDEQFDGFKGKKARLGKNWWTTLTTMHAIEIAGKKLDAGVWFLGIECDKEGHFHLLAMDSDNVVVNQLMPWAADTWHSETKIPLELHKGAHEHSQEKMQISLRADEKDPSHGGFSIRWGTHELTAKVAYHGAMSTTEASAKKEMESAKDMAGKKMDEAKDMAEKKMKEKKDHE